MASYSDTHNESHDVNGFQKYVLEGWDEEAYAREAESAQAPAKKPFPPAVNIAHSGGGGHSYSASGETNDYGGNVDDFEGYRLSTWNEEERRRWIEGEDIGPPPSPIRTPASAETRLAALDDARYRQSVGAAVNGSIAPPGIAESPSQFGARQPHVIDSSHQQVQTRSNNYRNSWEHHDDESSELVRTSSKFEREDGHAELGEPPAPYPHYGKRPGQANVHQSLDHDHQISQLLSLGDGRRNSREYNLDGLPRSARVSPRSGHGDEYVDQDGGHAGHQYSTYNADAALLSTRQLSTQSGESIYEKYRGPYPTLYDAVGPPVLYTPPAPHFGGDVLTSAIQPNVLWPTLVSVPVVIPVVAALPVVRSDGEPSLTPYTITTDKLVFPLLHRTV